MISRLANSFISSVILIFMVVQVSAQMSRNPKLSQQDLAAAQAQARDAGGPNSELIYAARLDLIQKGTFDSLIVIYAKPAKNGKDYYGIVVRDSNKYPLNFDKEGRVLKSGDQYLNTGLRHEEGKSPILRLMGAVNDPKKGQMQRNVDFQFNGSEFALVSQSMSSLPK